MKAQIRRATKQEKSGFFRPLVCVALDRVFYLYESWTGVVRDATDRIVISRASVSENRGYILPNGKLLFVECDLHGWYFDGHRVEERWPTPNKRLLVSGERVFRVKPEDDTLLFDYNGDVPPLDMVLVGFHLLLGVPGD